MNLRGLTADQWMAWERDGFLAIENFLSERDIAHYNEGLDQAMDRWKERGRPVSEYAKLNNIEQVSGIIEYDDRFLDLMEHPRMMSILRDLIGDSFLMIDNDGLVKLPGQVTHALWHRDTSHTLHVSGKRVPFMIKVFYFLADVPYDGGCLTFLPGSRYMRDDMLPRVEAAEDMPGQARMNVKAGTAVLFDGSTYHAALNNYSEQTRRSIIYNYGHLFTRTWPSYEPSQELQNKASTQLRKMLLGMLPWMRDPKAFAEIDQAAGPAST